MTSYPIQVTLWPSFCSVSHPVSPVPPVPSPEDHRESFRCSCLVKYYDARIGGLDHVPAIREATRLLRLSGHPWSHLDLVAKEINLALGRRPGRSRRGQP